MKKLLCRQSLLGILAAAACAAAPASFMRDAFTWTGVAAAGGNAAWSAHCNWHPGPFCLDPGVYPDDPDDDATFPWNASGAWDCDLIAEDIGDLTIEGSVDFDNPEITTVTLGVASLTIAPTQGDVEITVSGLTVLAVD